MRNAGPPERLLKATRLRVSGSWVRTLQRRSAAVLVVMVVFAVAPGCSLLRTAHAPRKTSPAGGEPTPAPAPTVLPPAIQDENLEGPPELEGPPLPPQEEEMVGPPLPPAGEPALPVEGGAAATAQQSGAGSGGYSSTRGEALIAAFGRKRIAAQPCARGVLVVLPESLFQYGTADLPKVSRQTLHEIASVILEAAGGVPVSVEGHTDSIEAEMFNQGLSERRARAVASELAAAGIAAKLLHSEGFGSRMPIAPNSRPDGSDDPDGRARNRRVEIIIETEKDAGR